MAVGSKMTPRIYVDTSVVGGCFDKEFDEDSRRLFRFAAERRITVLISEVVLDELAGAPEGVQAILPSLPPDSVEVVALTPEMLALRDAYLAERIVAPRGMTDATHVAAATVARASAIVSWNFRHIVRLDRIRLYNEVNRRRGYDPLVIVTPLEVTREGDSQEREDV